MTLQDILDETEFDHPMHQKAKRVLEIDEQMLRMPHSWFATWHQLNAERTKLVNELRIAGFDVQHLEHRT